LQGGNSALALLLFMLFLPLLTFFIPPVYSRRSRRFVFEADAYAASHSDGKSLATALLKLYQDNASTLTPDPWFVAFYYSHPPASQRIARIAA
jgi:STE24 endopeptidase